MSVAQLVYWAVAASSVVLVVGTVHARRATPSPKLVGAPPHDLWESAFLAGGPGRVADAAVAGMHSDGRLAIGGPGIVSARGPAVSHDPVESAVLDALAQTPGGSLPRLRATIMRSGAVQQIGDRLAARGLLHHPDTSRPWRRLAKAQIGFCMAVFFFGIFLSVTGNLDDGAPKHPQQLPFVFKVTPAVFAGILIGSLCRNAVGRRLTKAGKRELKRFRTANETLAAAPVDGAQPAALAVAVGGAALLMDQLLRDHLLAAQQAVAASAGTATVTASGGPDSGTGWSSPADGAVWCGSSGGSGCGGSSCGASSGGGHGGSSRGGGSSGGGSSCGSSSS